MPNEKGEGTHQGLFRIASNCARTYHASTNVGCFVIDVFGTIETEDSPSSFCQINRILSGCKGNEVMCRRAHLYGAYQAERFGGKYIYTCPFGLMHWTSPIILDGVMRGAIVAGPALVVESNQFLVGDLLRKHALPDKVIEEILLALDDVPVLTSMTIDQMAELLFIVGVHASGIPASGYYEDRDYLEHQADISEFIHHIKTIGGDDNSVIGYPIKKEKELLSLISLGDKAGSKKILNEIFGHIFFTTGGSFDVIKARVLELIVLLSRAALEGGADVEQIFGLNFKYTSEIHGFRTIEELTYWLSKIMVRFTDCVFNLTDVKHVDVIYRSIDFIKRNYMKKITLEEVASHVYLSPSYFSKIFKEEMKINFNTYLNNVRIEMSKKMLLDDTIVLVDISNLVGYEDQSYFSKVFKKVTGVSPGKFRESRGQIKSV